MKALSARYDALVKEGEIVFDPAQEDALKHLDDFLARFRAGARGNKKQGLIRRLARGQKGRAGIKGVYLHGGVGRGKTMLMNLVAQAADSEGARRIHFHAFMIEIHQRLKNLRAAAKKGEEVDYVETLAESIAFDTHLLCFDELHVDDIADAMILGPLFDALFRYGVAIVATSNYAPGDLYPCGLKRSRFLPFIALLKKNMDVVHLDSPVDYRMRALTDSGTYFYPLTDQSWSAMDHLFTALTGGQDVAPDTLDVRGRQLPVMRAGGRAGWLEFPTLCREARGAEDYLTLARRYKAVFIDGVPHMDEDQKNEARRFTILMDALYDEGCVAVIRAACPMAEIYGGDSYHFEFQRTLSRLMEMQGTDWLARYSE